VAFVPGPTNLQPVSGKLFVPRQFGPLNNNDEDVFEKDIVSALGSSTKFVDCWDLYHALDGEVHCGSNVKRSIPANNWWEVIEDE